MRVKVANWAIVESEDKVSKIAFSIQEGYFELQAYMINLVGCDMVLEVS